MGKSDENDEEILVFLYPELGPGDFGKKKDYRHEHFLTTVDEIGELTGLNCQNN